MTGITARERAAAQAYIRLLETTQAVFSDPALTPLAGVILTPSMTDADTALRAAGLTGNEARLLDLVTSLRSTPVARTP
ncbi:MULTISPECIES: hypothetical protein [Streptomyces]|uniref:Uncharacterized protein n=1 Tax=Streptomyces solicathayae TaxID=3081768 RepID=A0ABZ0M2S9_9ACTN|nr:hypothetical protein [Streptomyces sp. HUAS YS2]WOX26037.1 hypothetical protein R2D22_33495 [Streptomyces sp. HUAS YS2]